MATKQSKLRWSHDGKNTDGSAFDGSQFAGFTIEIDGAPAVSIPRQWETDGDYEMDLVAIAALATYGTHSVRMRTAAKNGQVSDPTPALTYTVEDTRVPTFPFGLSVD